MTEEKKIAGIYKRVSTLDQKREGLAQIGSHNKREKKAYKSNPDIDITKTKNNIELVPTFREIH